MNSSGNKLLMFTQPSTVAALNAADEGLKDLFRRKHGFVLYGWNYESRTKWMKRTLVDVWGKKAANAEALRLGIFEIHKIAFDGMTGALDPNPFAAPLPPYDPAHPFDLNEYLDSAISPEQIFKPKAPDHARVSRTFGKRALS